MAPGLTPDALVELALGDAVGQAPDVAGPKIYDAEYLMRSYLEAVGKHRPMWKIRMPGGAAAAVRAGANLAPSRAVGRRTWEDFLKSFGLQATPRVAQEVR